MTQETNKVYYKHWDLLIGLDGLSKEGKDEREQLLKIPPAWSFSKYPYLTINTIRGMLDTFFPWYRFQSEGIIKKERFEVSRPEWIKDSSGKNVKSGNLITEYIYHISKRVSLYLPNNPTPLVYEVDGSTTQSKLISDESMFGLGANLFARAAKQIVKDLWPVFRVAKDDDPSIEDEFYNPTNPNEITTTPAPKQEPKKVESTTPETWEKTVAEDLTDTTIADLTKELNEVPAWLTDLEKKAKANEIAKKYNINKASPHFEEGLKLIQDILKLPAKV